ncbi:MAG TPA: WHG domain-containing protein [Gaiellales bacterium]|nr:WHG domain-containing protein [Gaiellales bacterium]
MPRGLTPDQVVDRAAALVDADGLESLTLAGLAEHLGVRTPSLYNHVGGLADLRRRLGLRGLQELADRLRSATLARTGDDGLLALASAYRAFAREHPGLYQAVQRAPAAGDDERAAGAAAVLEPLLAVLHSYGLEGDDAVHAARGVRSALHGFAELERGGGFGIDLDLDESYRRLVGALGAGLRTPLRSGGGADGRHLRRSRESPRA